MLQLSVVLLWPTLPLVAEDSPPTRLTAIDKAQGWRVLFDGRTLDGWRGYRLNKLPAGWQVVEGALTQTGPGGDLASVDEFGNFEVIFEWKVSEGARSGVLYHVTEDFKTAAESGPEYQIVDNARHPDGRDPKTSAGACYALYPPLRDASRPVGEWNEGRIVVKGNHVEHWLNGIEVVSYVLDSADWLSDVAASPFAKFKDFGTIDKGPLVLRNNGDRVAFRNIKARDLP